MDLFMRNDLISICEGEQKRDKGQDIIIILCWKLMIWI